MATGILLYGYAKKDALCIRDYVLAMLPEADVFASAESGDATVSRLLSEPTFTGFRTQDLPLLMFVNVSRPQINALMSRFPAAIKRPMFCMLTAHNRSWTLNTLLSHLREEHNRFSQQA